MNNNQTLINAPMNVSAGDIQPTSRAADAYPFLRSAVTEIEVHTRGAERIVWFRLCDGRLFDAYGTEIDDSRKKRTASRRCDNRRKQRP